jgi:hypothetical protein
MIEVFSSGNIENIRAFATKYEYFRLPHKWRPDEAGFTDTYSLSAVNYMLFKADMISEEQKIEILNMVLREGFCIRQAFAHDGDVCATYTNSSSFGNFSSALKIAVTKMNYGVYKYLWSDDYEAFTTFAMFQNLSLYIAE